MSRPSLAAKQYVDGVLGGDRAVLGRALTLVESAHPDHRRLAAEVLAALLPHAGGSRRIGVSGVPGVGKSTFLEVLGLRRIEQGSRVAVLAVDPSSGVSGGSILGDKTRMGGLATHDHAFIRPSPSRGVLGGVTRTTRESIVVCEAAGYDVIFVETVGVGQSETVVADMVDTYLVLMLTGAGDDLQGIKRGILEVADVLAVNKADGDNVQPAERARRELELALRLLRPPGSGWTPPVLTCSGKTGAGLDEVWAAIEDHRAAVEAAEGIQARRRGQDRRWMWQLVDDEVVRRVREDSRVAALAPRLAAAVESGTTTPAAAAEQLLGAFLSDPPDTD